MPSTYTHQELLLADAVRRRAVELRAESKGQLGKDREDELKGLDAFIWMAVRELEWVADHVRAEQAKGDPLGDEPRGS